jgi:hypothetical protein
MPKKDAASAVVGMLSAVGEQTRRPLEAAPPVKETVPAPPVTVTEDPHASVSPLPTAPPPAAPAIAPEPKTPRTLRLRSTTAQRLRDAWLEAKRDDVLLTAQDFASDLVDEALRRRTLFSSSTS